MPQVGEFAHQHGEGDGGYADLVLKLTLPRSDLRRCEPTLLQIFCNAILLLEIGWG